MLLTPTSAQDFTSARRKAFLEDWFSFFTGRKNDLLSFEEVRKQLRLYDSAYRGLQEVPLDKIVGSTGRYRDFTRTFLPKNSKTEDRWRKISQVAVEQGYPPIEVFKVGDVYFVRDGNHRVSVARANDAQTIEAYVIEYKTPVPINDEDDLDDMLLKMERLEFLQRTGLDELRPGHEVEFTEPGRYRLVEQHIHFHKYVRETECGCELSQAEAVSSWYDKVYLPTIELIRERQVLKYFPHRTEADLYAWLLLHRAELEEEFGAMGYIPDEDLLDDLTWEHADNPLTRLVGLFGHLLDLTDMPLKVERSKFLTATRLDDIRPDHGIECTEPGCYQLMLEHIDLHKYLRETEQGIQLSGDEAVASWYDNVYRPAVQLIEQRRVTEYFPGNTEADLYIWLISRRAALEEEQNHLGDVPYEHIIDELEKETSSSPIRRLTHFLRHKLVRQSVLD